MKNFAYLAVVSLICVTPTWAQRSDFEFAVSGVLAEKLEPGTQLGFWNPSPAVNGAHFSLDDLPITLPFQLYGGHHWHVSFYEPKGRHTLFSVILSADLFDKPRAINLKLDRPRPRIRPTFSHDGDFHFAAGITKRMRYSDLPRWSNEVDRLVPCRPPVMQIQRQADGVTIQESEMETGCWASLWWASIDDSIDLAPQTDLVLVVRYDSGGLFDTIETKLNFRFDKNRHRPWMAE